MTRAVGQNLLPNTNWQLTSKLKAERSRTTAMKADGTEFQAQIDIQGFSTLNNQPTFYSNNTRELHDGALVVFGDNLDGLSGYALRVFSVVSNQEFRCQLPFQRVSPARSGPIIAFAAGIHEPGNSAFAPDGGWTKNETLIFWVDDFPTNQSPGSKRTLGLRKGINNNENFWWSCPPERLPQFRGRDITFGAYLRVKRNQSGATPRLFVSDGDAEPREPLNSLSNMAHWCH
jgi:hypothetical protein